MLAELFDQLLGIVRRKQQPGPPVKWIRLAANQFGLFHPVNHPADGNWLNIKQISQFALVEPRTLGDGHQHAPLGAGKPIRPGRCIETLAQQAGDIAEIEAEILHNVHSYIKCAYKMQSMNAAREFSAPCYDIKSGGFYFDVLNPRISGTLAAFGGTHMAARLRHLSRDDRETLSRLKDARIVSIAAIIAVAVTTEGKREIVGLHIGPSEADPNLH